MCLSRRCLVNKYPTVCTRCTTVPVRFGDCAHCASAGRGRTVLKRGCSFCHNLERGIPMASESGAVSGGPASSEVMDKGLKKGAIGYLSNIVIGVASTAPASAPTSWAGAPPPPPAYSLAATLGFIVAVKGVGVHAPAVLLVAFIPMLLVASAYKYFNRSDPDSGTTFAWVTRTFGPSTGWLNGWAIFLADLIVMASLA